MVGFLDYLTYEVDEVLEEWLDLMYILLLGVIWNQDMVLSTYMYMIRHTKVPGSFSVILRTWSTKKERLSHIRETGQIICLISFEGTSLYLLLKTLHNPHLGSAVSRKHGLLCLGSFFEPE